MKPTTAFMTTTVATTAAIQASASESSEAFLANVKSGETAKMTEAWHQAPKQPVSLITSLADLTLDENPAIAKCAQECINIMVHSVGKSKSNSKRKPVADALIGLLDHDSAWVKTMALRLSSLVCDGGHVPAIAKFLHDEAQREEAIYALERIPGEESTQAIITAYDDVYPAFQPRIVVALGHRGTGDVLPTLGKALLSDDTNLALTAMEAAARIGEKPPEGKPPVYNNLTIGEKRRYVNAYLRLMDAYVARGEYDEPVRVCNNILSGQGIDEEHFHCAAVVTLSNVDSPDAVALMIDALDADPYILRITAKNQLIAMEGDAVGPALKAAHESASGSLKDVLEEIVTARA